MSLQLPSWRNKVEETGGGQVRPVGGKPVREQVQPGDRYAPVPGGSTLSHSAASMLRFNTIRCARISTMAEWPRHLRPTSHGGAGGGGGVCHDAGGIGERP